MDPDKLQGELEPGEQIDVWLFAQKVPYAKLLFGSRMAAWSIIPYYVVLTDHRVLLVRANRLTRSVVGVEWAEQRDGVKIEDVERRTVVGFFAFTLRRPSDLETIRLRTSSRYVDQLDALTAQLS